MCAHLCSKNMQRRRRRELRGEVGRCGWGATSKATKIAGLASLYVSYCYPSSYVCDYVNPFLFRFRSTSLPIPASQRPFHDDACFPHKLPIFRPRYRREEGLIGQRNTAQQADLAGPGRDASTKNAAVESRSTMTECATH